MRTYKRSRVDAGSEVPQLAKAFLLVDAVPEHVEGVGRWLRTLPEVKVLHTVHYGHFTFLAEIEGRDHASLQGFIVNTVRHHRGVEQVREVDEEDVAAVLASEERPPA